MILKKAELKFLRFVMKVKNKQNTANKHEQDCVISRQESPIALDR